MDKYCPNDSTKLISQKKKIGRGGKRKWWVCTSCGFRHHQSDPIEINRDLNTKTENIKQIDRHYDCEKDKYHGK